MKKQFSLIALNSCATAGKDTFCNVIKEYCHRNKLKEVIRIALADKLKLEYQRFLENEFNLNTFTCDDKEKIRLRPFLVWAGKQKRIETQGKYWTDRLQPTLNNILERNCLPVCTDIRYCEYEDDEYHWVRKNNGILIHISRYNNDISPNSYNFKSYIQPANEEEKLNDPILKSKSDYKIEWPTLGPNPSYDQLLPFCEKVLKELF